MATPMHVYDEIAARYGADVSTYEGALKFWEEVVPTLSKKKQRAIFDELLARNGETPKPLSYEREYPKNAPIPKLSESPVAKLPRIRFPKRK